MTEKEQIKLKGQTNPYLVSGDILAKEIAKYLQKRGFDVKSKQFKSIRENGYPIRIEFRNHDFLVTKFAYLSTGGYDKWLSNSLSFFKTLKEDKTIAKDNIYSENGRTFKQFLKETKVYCMQQNLYHPENIQEKEDDYER